MLVNKYLVNFEEKQEYYWNMKHVGEWMTKRIEQEFITQPWVRSEYRKND